MTEQEQILICVFVAMVVALQITTIYLIKMAFDRIKRVSIKQVTISDICHLLDDIHKPPTIITKEKNLVPLMVDYEVPYWAENEVSQEEIKDLLAKEIAKQIPQYMEICSDKDIRRLVTLYRARIFVAKEQK